MRWTVHPLTPPRFPESDLGGASGGTSDRPARLLGARGGRQQDATSVGRPHLDTESLEHPVDGGPE